MSLTEREAWTVIHGMVLGAIFLLAFAGGLAGLWSLRPEFLTPGGLRERIPRLEIGTLLMAIDAWLTVITGTWIVYPWYRAPVPDSPRSKILASEATRLWHTLGMEWKEHVGWLTPLLATAVAFVVFYYGPRLAYEPRVRQALLVLFTLAFITAGIAGLFGAFLNKVAPIT